MEAIHPVEPIGLEKADVQKRSGGFRPIYVIQKHTVMSRKADIW